MKLRLALILILLFPALAAAQERVRNVRPDLIPLPPPYQFVDRILRPCSSGATPFVSAIAASDGDFDITTCVGRNVTINGTIITPSSLGNVIGPGSSTDNAIVRWNGTTGTLIKNSVFILDNSGNATTPGSLTTGNAGGVTGNIAISGATSGTVTTTVNAVAGTWTLTLPTTDGNAGEFLQTNGSGVTTWAAVSGGVTGSGTTNTLPKFTAASTIGDSRITDDGTDITATSGAGVFKAGDPANIANGSQLRIDDPGKAVYLAADDTGSAASLNLFGGATPSAILQTPNGSINIAATSGDVTTGSPTIRSIANGATDLGSNTIGYKQLFIDSTITAGGTTGNQTIDKSAGSVNFAAAATSLTVTSNKVTANSIVMCTVATNDTTLKSVQCVPGAGSFVMFANAAATAETRVNFWILNQ